MIAAPTVKPTRKTRRVLWTWAWDVLGLGPPEVRRD